MAEKIKIDIGSAYPFDEERTIGARGRDLVSGLPKTFTLSSFEINFEDAWTKLKYLWIVHNCYPKW